MLRRQVKALRGTVAQLREPLEQALLGSLPAGADTAHPGSTDSAAADEGDGEGLTAEAGRQEVLQRALMALYEFPDRSPGL